MVVHLAPAAKLILAGMAQLAPVLVQVESRALRTFDGLLPTGAAAPLIVCAGSPGAHGEHGAGTEAGDHPATPGMGAGTLREAESGGDASEQAVTL